MPVILIVDDAVENVLLLKNLLQDFGNVVFARNGVGALEQALQHRPDLVLLDVMMPELDGYETCRRLKAQAETRDIPVIFITGADGESDEEKGLALGAIDYITKPFSPGIVRARVQNHLALVRANAELREANDALRKFKAAVDCSSTAILITDRDARIEYANAAFSEVTGYQASEMLGEVPELLRSGAADEDGPDLWQTIMSGEQWRGELCRGRKDGTLLWQDVAIAPVYGDEGAITHIVALHSDITQRKQMEEELRRQAVTDALTGVANRRRLMEAGTKEVQRCRRSGESLAVVLIDIDHFKRVNDTLGHSAGDAVIQAVARMCNEVVRAIDTVGRLGGEEFAIVLPVTDLAGAFALAERLRVNIEAAPLQWERTPIALTVSMGVAQCTAQTGDFAALLSFADEALYEAKRAGRNRVMVADADGVPVGD